MEYKKGIVDVSCFLLVEDSGDSELDYEPIKQSQSNMKTVAAAAAADVDLEDMDAESCSCDTSYSERLDDFYEVMLRVEDEDHKKDFIDSNEAASSWSSCKIWSVDHKANFGYKYNLSANNEKADHQEHDYQEPRFGSINNLCREVMDAMEDKLFWETCMAVGYP